MTDLPKFIHLRCHSEHSLLEGAIPVKKLPGLAAKHGMPAVALTDSNALFAALEAHGVARAELDGSVERVLRVLEKVEARARPELQRAARALSPIHEDLFPRAP